MHSHGVLLAINQLHALSQDTHVREDRESAPSQGRSTRVGDDKTGLLFLCHAWMDIAKAPKRPLSQRPPVPTIEA